MQDGSKVLQRLVSYPFFWVCIFSGWQRLLKR